MILQTFNKIRCGSARSEFAFDAMQQTEKKNFDLACNPGYFDRSNRNVRSKRRSKIDCSALVSWFTLLPIVLIAALRFDLPLLLLQNMQIALSTLSHFLALFIDLYTLHFGAFFVSFIRNSRLGYISSLLAA
jgi:hypothetical protein